MNNSAGLDSHYEQSLELQSAQWVCSAYTWAMLVVDVVYCICASQLGRVTLQ